MPEPQVTEIIDADAFDPIPKKQIVIGGKRYGVLSLLDVDQLTMQKMKRFEKHISAIADEDEQLTFVRDLIYKFIPSLPTGALADMSVNKLSWILVKVAAPAADEVAGPLASSPAASN